MVRGHFPDLVHQLAAELTASAPLVGANTGPWPGMTLYRFTRPVRWMQGRIESLSLIIVAQGHHEFTVEGKTQPCDPFEYLLVGSQIQVKADVLEASLARPFLSMVLEIDPRLVHQVSSDMLRSYATALLACQTSDLPVQRACALPLSQELLQVVLRALRGTRSDMDRRVLAPLYLQEIIYRLLQPEHYTPLLALAAAESARKPVPAIIEYMRDHLAEPLTVGDMAVLAGLSPSAFAHLFREATGRPPYQFLKQMRLDHARELLLAGDSTVTRISKEVGYASVSHFISEFRTRFGMTPHTYRDSDTVDPAGTPRAADAHRRPPLTPRPHHFQAGRVGAGTGNSSAGICCPQQ
jgi:AraC-like DNA-binding protein